MNTTDLWNVDEENDIEEFCGILRELKDADLKVLYKALLEINEIEQHRVIREMRDVITCYGSLYNAYTARGLTDDPLKHIEAEMKLRLNKTDEELEEENVSLREMVIAQGKQLKRAVFAIYQLQGGLYNHLTQRYVLEERNAILHGDPLPEEPQLEDYDVYPTTRQGDAHEKRIQQLEDTVRSLEEKINAFDKRQNY